MKRFLRWIFLFALTGSMIGCDLDFFRATTAATTATTVYQTPYVELPAGQRSELSAALDRFDAALTANPRLIIHTEMDSLAHYPGSSHQNESSLDLQIDLVDFYIFSSLITGSTSNPVIEYLFEEDGNIHRFTADENNDIVRSIAVQDITMENMMDLLSEYGFSDDVSLDYLGDVKMLSSTHFTAKIGFPYWEQVLGTELVATVMQIQDVQFNLQYLDVDILFKSNFSQYVFTTSLDIAGTLQDYSFRLELSIEQEITIRNFEKLAVGDMGFNIPVSPTWNDIEFDVGSRSRHFQVYPNQDNWIRFYLSPGIYERTAFDDQYAIYDAEMNLLTEIRNYLTIPSEGYYYVNMQTDAVDEYYFTLELLDITDITYETIEGVSPGTIVGYAEGEDDFNHYYFPTQPYPYLLVFEFGATAGLLTYSDIELRSTKYCPVGHQVCRFFIDSQRSQEITVYTKKVGPFELHYRLVPLILTGTDPEDLYDISAYDEEHPLMIGVGVESASFLITIQTTGNYQILFQPLDYYGGMNDYQIVVYEGGSVTPTPAFWYRLTPGTYIVTVTGSQSTLWIFYPYLIKDS
ncbi:MAG TPA: hypothetical protein DCR44_06735 [Acholeplasmatales bacterium]|nr:MAG: hypothetical protein A2Y16_01850 [Tenericutes bacterium GWF2_57_13]HAQ57075.1 hypothetical protein [Acholeplasmatales bacterium]